MARSNIMILSKQQFNDILDNEGMNAEFLQSVGEGSGWENQQDIKEWFRLGSPYQKKLNYFSTWPEMMNHLKDMADELGEDEQMPKNFSIGEFEQNHLYDWSDSAVYIQMVDGKSVFIEVAFSDFI